MHAPGEQHVVGVVVQHHNAQIHDVGPRMPCINGIAQLFQGLEGIMRVEYIVYSDSFFTNFFLTVAVHNAAGDIARAIGAVRIDTDAGKSVIMSDFVEKAQHRFLIGTSFSALVLNRDRRLTA